jgi:serine/threonine protein kinase
VALRLIGPGHFQTPADLELFDEQQRRMASLHHPSLVACYAAGEWEGGRYVAMRFIRGATLSQLLEERVPPPVEALEPIINALGTAHAAGLVHGRVAPQNILVEAIGTRWPR